HVRREGEGHPAGPIRARRPRRLATLPEQGQAGARREAKVAGRSRGQGGKAEDERLRCQERSACCESEWFRWESCEGTGPVGQRQRAEETFKGRRGRGDGSRLLR